MTNGPIGENDHDLEDRLRNYASHGAGQVPPLQFDPASTTPPRPPAWYFLGASLAVMALAIAVVAGSSFVIRGVGAKPTATPTPTDTASQTEMPTTEPSVVLAPVIDGVLPGPEATTPPGVPLIAGVTVADVAAAAQASGLACEAYEQDPEMGASFGMTCTGESNGVSYRLRANFWTLESVSTVFVFTMATIEGGTIEARAAVPLFGRITALLKGSPAQAAAAHVEEKIDDAGCATDQCALRTSAGEVRLQAGVNGARVLLLIGQS